MVEIYSWIFLHLRGFFGSQKTVPDCSVLCVNSEPGSLEYLTAADRMPRSLFKNVFSSVAPTLLEDCTTFHAVNSIKLCYWPISLAMSSGMYLTNASSCLHVSGGLWLQGTKFWDQNFEVSIIACKFLTRNKLKETRWSRLFFFYKILLWLMLKLQFNLSNQMVNSNTLHLIVW